jgi:hypothetical protein
MINCFFCRETLQKVYEKSMIDYEVEKTPKGQPQYFDRVSLEHGSEYFYPGLKI